MSKGRINEIVRIQNAIENDRLSIGAGFEELLINDLSKVLREYFEFTSQPQLIFEKNIDGFKMSLSLKVARVRALNFIPK